MLVSRLSDGDRTDVVCRPTSGFGFALQRCVWKNQVRVPQILHLAMMVAL